MTSADITVPATARKHSRIEWMAGLFWLALGTAFLALPAWLFC